MCAILITTLISCVHIFTTHVHTETHAYIRTYVCTYIHTYIHTYIYTYIHTYIRTYIHTYMHTYIHTYILFHKHSTSTEYRYSFLVPGNWRCSNRQEHYCYYSIGTLQHYMVLWNVVSNHVHHHTVWSTVPISKFLPQETSMTFSLKFNP